MGGVLSAFFRGVVGWWEGGGRVGGGVLFIIKMVLHFDPYVRVSLRIERGGENDGKGGGAIGYDTCYKKYFNNVHSMN